MRRPYLTASGLTVGIFIARAIGAPALSDPTGAPLPASLHLHFPFLNILLAPAFDIWDGVSMLGMRQLVAFFIWSAVGMLLWRVGRQLLRRPARLSVRSLLAEVAIVSGGASLFRGP